MERITVGVIRDFGPQVRWTIPDFFLSLEKSSKRYTSPYIQYEDSGFNLELYKSGNKRIGVALLGLPKNATFILGIEGKDGKEYQRTVDENFMNIRPACVSCGVSEIYVKCFEQKFNFSGDMHEIREEDKSLTVFCNLRSNEIITEAAQSTTNKESIESSPENFKTLILGSDVTFNVKGRQIRANREVLQANSPVFCSMFKHDTQEKKRNVVDIDDCEPDIFLDFLAFLYLGRINEMPKGNAVGVYNTADKYDVKQLKDECVQFMIKEISVDTFCDYTTLALQYNESTLLKASTKFFKENPKTVTLTSQWKPFLKENPDAANELILKAFEKSAK